MILPVIPFYRMENRPACLTVITHASDDKAALLLPLKSSQRYNKSIKVYQNHTTSINMHQLLLCVFSGTESLQKSWRSYHLQQDATLAPRPNESTSKATLNNLPGCNVGWRNFAKSGVVNLSQVKVLWKFDMAVFPKRCAIAWVVPPPSNCGT